MEHKAWLDALDKAVSLAAASQVVSNYLNEPGHDHQVAVKLIAAFRARRERQKAADALTVAAHRRHLRECTSNVQAAHRLSVGQYWIYEDSLVLSSPAALNAPQQQDLL